MRTHWAGRFLPIFVLLGFWGIWAYRQLWLLTPASDALEYLGPALIGDTVGGWWPWLDRLFLGVILRLVALIPGIDPAQIGPTYALTLTLTSLGVVGAFLARTQSSRAAICFVSLAISSYYVQFFSTQIFTEPLLMLLLWLSLIQGEQGRVNPSPRSVWMMGFLAGAAAFTKITGLALAFSELRLWARRSPRGEGLRWLTGVLGAGVLIAVTFTLLFGWPSLVDVVETFFRSGVKANLAGRAEANNVVTFWDVIVDRLHWPVFISALILVPQPHQHLARSAYTTGWFFFGWLSVIYLLSGRGHTPIEGYLYPAWGCFLLSFSLVLADRLPLWMERLHGLPAAAWTLVIFVVGALLTSNSDPTQFFRAGFHPDLNPVVKFAIASTALLVPATLLALRLRPHSLVAIACWFFSLCWGGLYAVGKARHHFATTLIPDSSPLYEKASLLAALPSGKWHIHSPQWERETDLVRLRHIFLVFYDRVGSSRRGTYDEAWVRARESWTWLRGEPEAESKILTQRPDEISAKWAKWRVAGTYLHQGQQWFAMEKAN